VLFRSPISAGSSAPVSSWPSWLWAGLRMPGTARRVVSVISARTVAWLPGLGYSTNGQVARALAAEITSAGGAALAIGADLRRPEASSQRVQAAADALGTVDVLVSNAGLSHVQPPEDITAAQFDEMLALNLRAPFLLAQCAVPSMPNGGSAGSCSSPRSPRSPAASSARITRRPRPGCTG
jgi:NAD(P)-dependent dehydrogenase (short-subunit alcohol dehydrogenase family)